MRKGNVPNGRSLAISFLACSGMVRMLRQFVQRRRVTILMLHDPAPDRANRMFTWLKRHYNIIPLKQLVAAMENEDWSSLPDRAMAITFDDGHIGNYDLLPLLKTHQIPVTIFLCGGLVNTNRHFWFRYQHLSCSSDYYKTLSNSERIQQLALLGFDQHKEYEKPQALNRDHVNQMLDWVDFQSHGLFHPCFTKCTDDECREEMEGSIELFRKHYELPVYSISFPNGDYSSRELELARLLGYRCAFTTEEGFNGPGCDPFKLKRISINDKDGIAALAVKSSGAWFLLKRLARRMRKIKAPERVKKP